MDILKKNQKNNKSREFEDFFSRKETAEENEILKIENQNRFSNKFLARWKAHEFEIQERDKRWYLYAAFIFFAIIGYAVYKDSPVMAITFILIGMILYINLNKEPKIIEFGIIKEGIVTGNQLYEFDNMRSFWIYYDPPHEKTISLHTKSHFLPFIHIPLDQQDPVEVRKILVKYIPEVKQSHGLIDHLEKFLRI